MQLSLPRFQELGATLATVTPETPDNSLSTREKLQLAFEVLSDSGNRLARQFGIVFALPLELRPIYTKFGIDLPATNGDDSFELPLPATYIIGEDRRIEYAFVDTDYTKRADPEDIAAALTRIN